MFRPSRLLSLAQLRNVPQQTALLVLICSFMTAESVLEDEPRRWSVLSACKHVPRKELCAGHCHLNFDDLNRANLQDSRIRSQVASGWLRPPKPKHVEAALRFARSQRLQDLLLHCREGVSRSPGIAWCILLDQLGCPERATSELFAIHAQCRPNDLIVQLGLEVIKGSTQDLTEVLAGIDKSLAPQANDAAAERVGAFLRPALE